MATKAAKSRARYNPRDVQSAIKAASRCEAVQYVYATAYGYAVTNFPPPDSLQNHYYVHGETVQFVEPPKPWNR